MTGTAAEFDEFVAARGRALMRTALLLTGDRGAAEDVVQHALMKAWLRWERIGGLEHAEAYVRAIVVNTQRNWWRLRRSGETATDALPEGTAPDHAGDVSRRNDVLAALRTLPARQRAVVVLRYYEDMTEAQTAAALGCSVGTVKSQTARAFASLRRVMGDALTLEVTP